VIISKHLDPASLDRMLVSFRPAYREEWAWYKGVGELVAAEQKNKTGGLFLEFGTASGLSARWLTAPDGIRGLCCFDTFDGLPEAWCSIPAGTFAQHGRKPILTYDCQIVKGMFQDTLPGFLAERQDHHIAFAHIDCDLYSSAAFVLSAIGHLLIPESVLVFDELFDYYGYTIEHEAKAFLEWYRDSSVDLELVMTCNAPDISGKAFLRVVDTKTIKRG